MSPKGPERAALSTAGLQMEALPMNTQSAGLHTLGKLQGCPTPDVTWTSALKLKAGESLQAVPEQAWGQG